MRRVYRVRHSVRRPKVASLLLLAITFISVSGCAAASSSSRTSTVLPVENMSSGEPDFSDIHAVLCREKRVKKRVIATAAFSDGRIRRLWTGLRPLSAARNSPCRGRVSACRQKDRTATQRSNAIEHGAPPHAVNSQLCASSFLLHLHRRSFKHI
jgi:hypothetical protein